MTILRVIEGTELPAGWTFGETYQKRFKDGTEGPARAVVTPDGQHWAIMLRFLPVGSERVVTAEQLGPRLALEARKADQSSRNHWDAMMIDADNNELYGRGNW